MYQVCDNNNTIYVNQLGGLIYATSDSKKFYLIGSDIDYIMKSLDDGIVVDMDMSD